MFPVMVMDGVKSIWPLWQGLLATDENGDVWEYSLPADIRSHAGYPVRFTRAEIGGFLHVSLDGLALMPDGSLGELGGEPLLPPGSLRVAR